MDQIFQEALAQFCSRELGNSRFLKIWNVFQTLNYDSFKSRYYVHGLTKHGSLVLLGGVEGKNDC